MIRFHLDENVEAAVARALVDRGYDVTTTSSAGLEGADDEEHLAFALRERRVVVTHDADFLRLHAAGSGHFGIGYCPVGRGLGDLVRSLVLLAECLSDEEMRDHVEFL